MANATETTKNQADRGTNNRIGGTIAMALSVGLGALFYSMDFGITLAAFMLVFLFMFGLDTWIQGILDDAKVKE